MFYISKKLDESTIIDLEGHIKSEYLPHQIQEAQKCGILKDKEATKMKEYHKKVFELLSVDDFDQKELGRH